MANNRCYLATVTRDSNGNIVKVVPYTPPESAQTQKSVSNGLVAAKSGGLISNPLLIGGAALALILFTSIGGTAKNG